MTRTRRYLAAGGTAVLAAAAGVALLLQNGGSACAAPPPASLQKGKATYFGLDGTLGNCSFPSPPADDLFVALGPEQYSAAAACGTYIDVTGPKGKVRVKVIDSCPECPVGHLDLSLTAFRKIADEEAGIVPITYRSVPGAATPGPITVRVTEGSSRYWLGVLIDNHSYQLRSVTINGRATHRADYNYWIADAGAGPGPFRIRITDVYGHAVTVSGVDLVPETTQRTSKRLAGGVRKQSPSPTLSRSSPAPKRSSPAPVSSSPAPVVSSSVPALSSSVPALSSSAPVLESASCG